MSHTCMGDLFDTAARYAYRKSLEILTGNDYMIALCLLMISFCLALHFKKKKDGGFFWMFSFTALIPYMYLVFAFAVLRRPEDVNPAYELMPFWSYVAAFRGKWILLLECLLNVLMFMPLGICLSGINIRLRYAAFFGILMSYTIELSQLLSHKGLFELFDDPVHNVLGCMIGYLVCEWMKKKNDDGIETQ